MDTSGLEADARTPLKLAAVACVSLLLLVAAHPAIGKPAAEGDVLDGGVGRGREEHVVGGEPDADGREPSSEGRELFDEIPDPPAGALDLPVSIFSIWTAYSHTWTTNPATGQPWTVAQVNALEAGMRKYDYNPGGDSETRVTTLYVTVTFQDGTTYAHDDGPMGMNELLSISGGESVTFTYTDNGEVATRTEGVTWTYAYTAAGLLREVKEGPTVRAQYFYDGLGRRVKATESGTTTFFVYGLGMDPLFERAGTTDTRHVYVGGVFYGLTPDTGVLVAYNFYAGTHTVLAILAPQSAQTTFVSEG